MHCPGGLLLLSPHLITREVLAGPQAGGKPEQWSQAHVPHPGPAGDSFSWSAICSSPVLSSLFCGVLERAGSFSHAG